MRSTSCSEIAKDVLERCIAGRPPKELPRALVADACGNAFFGTLVEGLADRFEPSLCDAYARLFSQAVAYTFPETEPASLVARYERVRRTRPVYGKPQRIFILSRVTLGADVAVTSVMLSAAKRRFPHAAITFVGPEKNFELFAADPHVHKVSLPYRRGGLRERLSVWEDLKKLCDAPGSVVIDPDSRLTQLGLLPICQEDRYHLFESRSYGGDSDKTITELATHWAAETFGIPDAKPYIALGQTIQRRHHIAISLGVGGNQTKRIPDPFEAELLALLASTGSPICVDKGGSDEEAERVEKAVQAAGVPATLWQGTFAGFASIIASSRLYVGYDSAGQHVAAAAGVPLLSIFSGFPVPRMFDRWRPAGPACSVIRVDRPDGRETLERVRTALAAFK